MSDKPNWTLEQYSDALDARFELEQRIILKAWRDEAFRQQLLSDPAAALAGEIPSGLPEGLQVRVREETATKLFLRVPSPPGEMQTSEELTDEALEEVAGGGFIYSREGPSGGETYIAVGRRGSPTKTLIWSAPDNPPTPIPGTSPKGPSDPEPEEPDTGECPPEYRDFRKL